MDNNKKKRPVTTRTSRSHWTAEDWDGYYEAIKEPSREVMEGLAGAQAEAWQAVHQASAEATQPESRIRGILNRFKRIFQR